MTIELKGNRKVGFKKEVLGLMALSSLFFSLNFIFFKYFAINADFWTTSFWEYLGFTTLALSLFIFIKPYREQFLSVFRVNSKQVITINALNELVNIAAKLAFNFASLLVPVTLVWIVNGIQPLFVFLYGIILTIFFPHISQENISRRSIWQKLLAIGVMAIGSFLLQGAN